MGFSGTSLDDSNLNIQNYIKNGIGGVILFSENIESYEQAKCLTTELQSLTEIPLFISIDQEGGRVERTINIKNKLAHLSPRFLAETQNIEFIKNHTQIMAEELLSMGINMNFAPVLDVNTNLNNPIIGERSFSHKPEEVEKFSKPVYETFIENKIIPVVKHFPGHGNTGEDSHLVMPSVELSLEEMERVHIKPFKTAFENGVNAVMVAHVYYKAFDREKVPASLSENVIKKCLRQKLGFNGLIISDDMVMKGVTDYSNSLEACIKAIKASVDIFIFRDSNIEREELVENLAEQVKIGIIPESIIDSSMNRIIQMKKTIC